MRRVFYLVQKEFRQILREKAFLGIIFVMPLIQIIVLGVAISTDVKNVPLAIVDKDLSASSRRIIDSFVHSESFNFVTTATSSKEALNKIDDGSAKLVIIIPHHFERDLKKGESPKVQAILDGVDGNSAGIAMAYVNLIANKLQKEWLQSSGLSVKKMASVHLVEIEPRMLYNATLESKNSIVPGIVAVLLLMITSFLTGMSIVKEKEIGTMEQLLVTPITTVELMLGKIIPFVIAGFLLMNIGILAAGFIFGLWMKGSLFLFYGMSMIFILSTLGLGIFASTVSQTQQQAMFLVWFFSVFAILLSGFFVPIENMPDWVQYITLLNPLRYFMVIVREIYLKGTGMLFLWKEALAMAVFGLSAFILSAMRFQKRVK
jgi:drug efflux transport system permease protein